MTCNEILPHKGRAMNPTEKGDALASLGYTVRRTDRIGVYLVRKPNGVTYSVNVPEQQCSCPATVPYCCHLAHCHWFYSFDRAVAQLAERKSRHLWAQECEDSLWAAEWHLRRIAGDGAVVVVAERMAA